MKRNLSLLLGIALVIPLAFAFGISGVALGILIAQIIEVPIFLIYMFKKNLCIWRHWSVFTLKKTFTGHMD